MDFPVVAVVAVDFLAAKQKSFDFLSNVILL